MRNTTHPGPRGSQALGFPNSSGSLGSLGAPLDPVSSPNMPQRLGSFAFAVDPEGVNLVLKGAWTIRQAGALDQELRLATLPPHASAGQRGLIDMAGLTGLDTAGAWLVRRVMKLWVARGMRVVVQGARPEHGLLLDEVAAHDGLRPARRTSTRTIPGLLASLGGWAQGSSIAFVGLTAFLGELAATAAITVVRPWRYRMTSFSYHLEHTGIRAVPIICLICLLIGAVIMQQGALQLRSYGAESFAVKMLGVLCLREVGVLLTAIMVAGRSASAFTAEIGAMKMRGEIDAMRILGLQPMETLVLPRVLALMIALPILTFIGDIMCLAGGGIYAVWDLGLDWPGYIERMRGAISIEHFIAGMVKTPFAALIIGLIGCQEGMSVKGSAESLGQHVTNAVVKAIFLVIILDAMFALFLSSIGV